MNKNHHTPFKLCIDGPGGSGKSTLAQQLIQEGIKRRLSVHVISDTEVSQQVLSDSFSLNAYGNARLVFSTQAQLKGVDIIIQERGLVSHLVYDHLLTAKELAPLCCCEPDRRKHDLALVLLASPETLSKRLAARGQPKDHRHLDWEVKSFQLAAQHLGWHHHPNENTHHSEALLNLIVSHW